MGSMFRSATLKLTAWYLAMVMTISIIFSLALYHVATDELARGIHRESERISRQFPVFQDNPILRSTTDYSRSQHALVLELLLLNLGVLVLAGLAGFFLARRTLEPIEQAHHRQARFTADVSHELRTPLTALRMESEVALLDDKSTPQDLRATLTSNIEEVGKMEILINNLLRLTKLDAGQLEQSFSDLQSKPIVDSAIEQVGQLAQHQSITIENKSEDLALFGDPISLTQAIVVLLDNAIKYSPAGSTVSVTSRIEGANTLLSVNDTGKGIDKQALEHIFDRFYRVDASRNKTTQDGYGLGLSIAHMIANVHHGSIAITSRAGHGTKATLSIPTSGN
ncbi:MAG: HAMP domain-containing sensor histidine kinase [Candidatus Saccharibacteria bacterium]